MCLGPVEWHAIFLNTDSETKKNVELIMYSSYGG